MGEIEILSKGGRTTSEAMALPTSARDADQEIGIVFEDQYLTVVRDAVRFPSGVEGTYLRIFETADLTGSSGAVCIPVYREKILLLRVYRHATRRWELELPRGSRLPREDPLTTALREVEEELGFRVLSAKRVGEICPNSGLFAGVGEVFVVAVSEERADAVADSHEALGEIVSVDFAQLSELISHGAIRDAQTLAALMLAHAVGMLDLRPDRSPFRIQSC